ncbi:MAG: DUF4157 domain-containing protein [Litorilinea sp.]
MALQAAPKQNSWTTVGSIRQASIRQAKVSDAQALQQSTVQRAMQAPGSLSAGDILALQRSAGNQAVVQLLGRTSAPHPVQRNSLTVGPANDRFEQEADRIAQAVVDNPGTQNTNDESRGNGVVQRQTAGIGPEGGRVDTALASRLRQTQNAGAALPVSVRRAIEPKLGAELGSVKVHTDSAAVQLSRAMGAKAFTHKNHIYYGAGQSPSDLRLTAHEAVHTIQQGAVPGTVTRSNINATVQRVTGHDDEVLDYMTTSTDDAFKDKSGEVSDYLNQLRATNRFGIRKHGKQRKAARNLLNLDLADKPERAEAEPIFRSILLAELAAGQGNEYVAFLKDEMTRLFETRNQTKYTVQQFRLWFKGRNKPLENLLGWINPSNPEIINKMGRHNSEGFEKRQVELKDVQNAIAMSQASIEQFPPTTKTSTEYLMGKRTLNKSVEYYTKAENAWTQRRWYDFNQSIDDAKLWYKAADEQMRASNISKQGKYVTQHESGEARQVGGGQFSKVYKLNYKDESPGSIGTGYFKSEQREYAPGDAPAAFEAGIPAFGGNFSNRAVAVYKLDKLFGFDLVPKTKLAVHNNIFGTVMEKAEGKSPQETRTHDDGDVSVLYRNFDMRDFEIMRGLSGIQLFDAITGQLDRHGGNYFIEQGDGKQTKVHAIDNDLAFAVNNDDSTKAQSKFDKYAGMPQFVDVELARRIAHVTPEQIGAVLAPLLAPPEIAVTIGRFRQVRAHLLGLAKNTGQLRNLKNTLHRGADILRQRRDSGEDVSATARTLVERFKQLKAEILQRGALLDANEWTQEIADLHTSQNSYFGSIRDLVEKNRAAGKLIGRDED